MIDLKDDASLSRFDSADYLTSEEAVREYLADAIAEGNPASIASAQDDAARARARVAARSNPAPKRPDRL